MMGELELIPACTGGRRMGEIIKDKHWFDCWGAVHKSRITISRITAIARLDLF